MDRGTPPGRRRLGVAVVAASLLLVLPVALPGCGRADPPETFHGVRLGMTPGDVRARFKGPKGAWRAVPGSATLLDYTPDSGEVPKVRFEFHSGMLVAVRATLDAGDSSAKGGRRELTPGSVLVREPSGGPGRDQISLTWLSRDCPTHKDEAARLALAPP